MKDRKLMPMLIHSCTMISTGRMVVSSVSQAMGS